MELVRKERSKTTGRQLEQKENRGRLLPRSKTSARQLGEDRADNLLSSRSKTSSRDGVQERKSPGRSRDDWKFQDRGRRYQVG